MVKLLFVLLAQQLNNKAIDLFFSGPGSKACPKSRTVEKSLND
jgi:hypothetical protein